MLIKLLRQEKIIAPLTLSYFLIFASQGVRLAYGYKIYVQLLFLPVFLTGVLICASMLTKHADDNDFAGRFERGKIRPRALYYLLFILLLLLIGLRLIGILWGKNYLSPLFEAQYISGNAHVDTLFHSALSNMIMNFGRPSIGVEGLPIIHYHFASHILIGSIGKLFGVGAYEAYNLIAPVFLMPLFLGLLLNLIDVAQKILKIDVNQDRMTIFSLAFFYIALSGILPDAIRQNLGSWDSVVTSQSYSLALAFLYLFITITLVVASTSNQRIRVRVKLILVTALGGSLITFLKISVGTMWCVGLAGWWIQKPKKLDRLLPFLSSGIGWLIVLPIVANLYGSEGDISPLNFFMQYIERDFISMYPIVHYGLVIVLFLLMNTSYVKNRYPNSIIKPTKYIMLFIVFFGAIPGLILSVGGGGAVYFSNVSIWVALAIILIIIAPVIDTIEKRRLIELTRNIPLLILSILIFITPLYNTVNLIRRFAYKTNVYLETIDPSSKALWDELHELRKRYSEPIAASYRKIPIYGRKGMDDKRTWMSGFLSAPAISGIPNVSKIETIVFKEESKPLGYGFDSLVRENSKTTGIFPFKTIIIE